MIYITFPVLYAAITGIWLLVRVICWLRKKAIHWKRELQLMLVYISIVVVARFTCFPFEMVDGKLQPLVLDTANIFSFRINLVPFVSLFDYPEFRSALLNLIGNTTMFIPIGVIWPIVYQKLDSPAKVITAGIGFSLCIELLQLPFYDRVTDIDDLILNSIGYLIGYGLYALVKTITKWIQKKNSLR